MAVKSGAQVEFGVTVTNVSPGDPKPSVTTASGETITADIIIGADGPRSLVREVVLGKKDNPEPVGWTVYGATVPESYMLNDPELASWLTSNEVSIYVNLMFVLLLLTFDHAYSVVDRCRHGQEHMLYVITRSTNLLSSN